MAVAATQRDFSAQGLRASCVCVCVCVLGVLRVRAVVGCACVCVGARARAASTLAADRIDACFAIPACSSDSTFLASASAGVSAGARQPSA